MNVCQLGASWEFRIQRTIITGREIKQSVSSFARMNTPPEFNSFWLIAMYSTFFRMTLITIHKSSPLVSASWDYGACSLLFPLKVYIQLCLEICTDRVKYMQQFSFRILSRWCVCVCPGKTDYSLLYFSLCTQSLLIIYHHPVEFWDLVGQKVLINFVESSDRSAGCKAYHRFIWMYSL